MPGNYSTTLLKNQNTMRKKTNLSESLSKTSLKKIWFRGLISIHKRLVTKAWKAEFKHPTLM